MKALLRRLHDWLFPDPELVFDWDWEMARERGRRENLVQKIKRVHCASKDLEAMEIPAGATIIRLEDRDAYVYVWYSVMEGK